jgi:hypothetical protein
VDDGDRSSRLIWITDILPNDIAGDIQMLINQGAVAIRQTLEGQMESTEFHQS